MTGIIQNHARPVSVLKVAWLQYTIIAIAMLSTLPSFAVQRFPENFKFNLPNQNGRYVDITHFQGKIVLVNFWATWCKPCIKELGSMAKLQSKLGNEKFSIIAINVGEKTNAVTDFLSKKNISPNFDIVFDFDQRVAKSVQASVLPLSLTLDKQGNIIDSTLGARDWTHPEIIAELRSLISKN